MELFQPKDTHVGVGGALTRLDRAHCLMLGHTQLTTQIDVRGSPAEWHERGVRDHSPIVMRVGAKAARRTDLLVPLEVLRSELYEEYALAYVSLACASVGMSQMQRWHHSRSMRLAARLLDRSAVVRREMFITDGRVALRDGRGFALEAAAKKA